MEQPWVSLHFKTPGCRHATMNVGVIKWIDGMFFVANNKMNTMKMWLTFLEISFLCRHYHTGITPLMEAAVAGHEIIFSILLEHVSEYAILRANLKVRLSPPPKNCFIYFNESPLKIIKIAFHFFVLKIFQFLSWLLGHVEKTARLAVSHHTFEVLQVSRCSITFEVTQEDKIKITLWRLCEHHK